MQESTTATSAMDEAALKALNRRLKKNMYQREKQAIYRRLDKMEIAFQRERVAVLEEMLQVARANARGQSNSSVLSWQDIALALQESEEQSVERNTILKRRVQRSRAVLNGLKTWIFTRLTAYPSSSVWRNVVLMQSPESRQIGMDWITKQLLYNADTTFQKYGFPAPNSPEDVDDYLYFYDGDGLVAVQRNQYIVNSSLDEFYARITSDQLMGSENLNKNDRHCNPDILQRVYDSKDGIRTNFISRIHKEPDRISFVGQHVNDDEKFPTGSLQRHRVVISFCERVGLHQTKIRSVQLMSSVFTKDGQYLSVDDEAKLWGYDLGDCPDHLKQEKFLQCTKQVIARQIARRKLIKKSSWYVP
ncbi:hypothetical protein LEN26_014545 [Aphanomyces euteiches]|nr:hypothetical protein LEN26_014545 [Aphanomyces euteiches]